MSLYTTSRLGLVVPMGDDAIANGDDLLRTLADYLDTHIAIADRGPIAGRPAAASAHAGKRLYTSTDEGTPNPVYLDIGTGWLQINPAVLGAGNGIAIASNVAAVLLAATPGLEFSSGALRAFTDETTVERSASGLRLKDGGVTAAKMADALKPSAGAGGGTEALRSLGTGAGQAMPGNTALGKEVSHGWAAAGVVRVPAGDDDVLPDTWIPAGHTLKHVKFKLGNGAVGTTVTFKLQSGGSDISGYTGITTPTSTAWGIVDAADVDVSNAGLQPIVTATAGIPKNLSIVPVFGI